MEHGSLRVRLILMWIIVLLITLSAASFGLEKLFERSIMRRTLAELTLDIGVLAEALQRDGQGNVKLVAAPTDPQFTVAYGGRYWQVSQAGLPLLRSSSLWNARLTFEAPQKPSTEPPFVRLDGPDGQSLFGLSRTVALDRDASRAPINIVAAVDYAELDHAMHRFTGDLWIGLLGIAALLLLAASAHVVIGLKPLKEIQARLARVRSGEISRLDGNFPSEVMPLVAETNALLDAQDRALDVARTRAGNLAHGLKTPLAVMASQSRALRRRGDSEIAGMIDQQIEQMRRHVERELARARVRGAGRTHHQRIDTATAISDLAGTMKLLPKGQDLEWELVLTRPLLLGIDRTDFHELMGNLIDNAHKWARSKVRVQTVVAGNRAVLTVEDDGPGVAEPDMGRILERGERADTSVPGSGLGLAIVSDLVAAYRGGMTLARSRLGGLAVVITLDIEHPAVPAVVTSVSVANPGTIIPVQRPQT